MSDPEPLLWRPTESNAGRPPEGGAPRSASDRPAPGPAVLTVTELTRLVRDAIQARLPGDVHVVGEVSNFTRAATGHLYFTLKDASAEVRCVMWRSAAQALRFAPRDGMELIATGTVDVYEPRGQYQLYVRRLEPRGVGALELAFRQLKERLEREGLFDPRRKRPLPRIPRRIAVVTSPTGAAVRDIVQTVARRFPCVHLLLFGVRVQGDNAAAEIAGAIRRINLANDRLGGIDVMIVGRGGGSLEDLWAFNEEIVARAIHASGIPVVSAVGHETDFTIADFVADVRAATPTAAAELVVPVLGELVADIDQRQHRLARAVRARLDSVEGRLTIVERFEWFRDPLGCVRRRAQDIDESAGRLALAAARALSRSRSRLHDAELRLSHVRPVVLLDRRRQRLTRMDQRLAAAYDRLLRVCERRLAAAFNRWTAASPRRHVERWRAVLDQVDGRLLRGAAASLDTRVRAVAAWEARLTAASHDRVLARGFSITRRTATGEIVTAPTGLKDGDRLSTQTAGGMIESEVVDADQPRLFG